MQEEKQNTDETSRDGITNRQIPDNGGKIIFENPLLCSQLFKNYVDMEALKNIKPEDIEDVTERFIPMFTEQRDADVIKKVHLANHTDIFITLIEHKSAVDYNVVMQILRYMIYIWEDYENQMEKSSAGISKTKGFKYPPILPIVYYEGKQKWTSAREFADRIVLRETFKDYIPNFKYYLICLEDHNREELISKRDELSFVMLINSLKNADEFKNLRLPDEYLVNLFSNSPNDVLRIISKVIAVVLRKQNVPENDIRNMVDKIERRQPMGLFDDWEGFDVQEERRIGQIKGEEIRLIKLVTKMLTLGWDVSKTADLFDENESHIQSIYDIAKKYAPDYDPEKIYNELSPEANLIKK